MYDLRLEALGLADWWPQRGWQVFLVVGIEFEDSYFLFLDMDIRFQDLDSQILGFEVNILELDVNCLDFDVDSMKPIVDVALTSRIWFKSKGWTCRSWICGMVPVAVGNLFSGFLLGNLENRVQNIIGRFLHSLGFADPWLLAIDEVIPKYTC